MANIEAFTRSWIHLVEGNPSQLQLRMAQEHLEKLQAEGLTDTGNYRRLASLLSQS